MPNHFHGIIIVDPLLKALSIRTKTLSELIGAVKTTA